MRSCQGDATAVETKGNGTNSVEISYITLYYFITARPTTTCSILLCKRMKESLNELAR